MTMRLSPALVVGLSLAAGCAAQTCSDGSSGFSTISELNAAMEAEIQLIEGGQAPQASYEFILCANTTFDTSFSPLRPLLSGASFLCGANSTSLNACTFQGGDQQVFIQDSQVSNYPLETVLFSGITFEGFADSFFLPGTSINVVASSTTTATFDDVIWTSFASETIVKQVPADSANPPATVDISNSVVLGGDASLSSFVNDGGDLTLSNVIVEGHTAANFITTTNRGSSTLIDSVVTQSSIQKVTETQSRGVQRVEGVNVTDMLNMTTTFQANNSGTSFILVDSLIENNALSEPWEVVDVRGGAVGQIVGTSISTNTAMLSGIVSQEAQSAVSVEDSFLSNNVGLGPNITSTPLFAIENSALSVERTELNNNREFSGQVLVFFASTATVSRSCFQNGNSNFLAFVDKQSTLTVSENFVSNSISSYCPAPGDRLFVEDISSGCFTNGICEGTCELLADQTSCLAGIPAPTVPPTPAPTGQPTISAAPSVTPTTSAPTSSSFPTTTPTTSAPIAIAPGTPTAVQPTAPISVPPPTPSPTLPPTLTPTRGGLTVNPTACQDITIAPTKSEAPKKMKLGPRSTKSYPGGMMKKVIHTTYYQSWVDAEYLRASEASDHLKSADLQLSSEALSDPPEITCAPVGGPPSKTSAPFGKGVPPPTIKWGKKSKATKAKSTKSMGKAHTFWIR